MYVRKDRKVRQVGVGLWDSRRAGLTMPEPIINHGYNTGVSALGLWDSRSAGETMPEPKINRAYIAGVVYDNEPGDYPQLKNPPGIAPAGLGGVEVTVSRSVEGLSGCGRCHQCQQGLGCWHRPRGVGALGGLAGFGRTSLVDLRDVAQMRLTAARPNMRLTDVQAFLSFLSYVRKTATRDGNVRYSAMVNYVEDGKKRSGVKEIAIPLALAEKYRKIMPGLPAQAELTGEEVRVKSIADVQIRQEQAEATTQAVELQRQDVLDAKFKADFDKRNSFWALFKSEFKDKIGDAALAIMPAWMWYTGGALIAAGIYYKYFHKSGGSSGSSPSNVYYQPVISAPAPAPEVQYGGAEAPPAAVG